MGRRDLLSLLVMEEKRRQAGHVAGDGQDARSSSLVESGLHWCSHSVDLGADVEDGMVQGKP